MVNIFNKNGWFSAVLPSLWSNRRKRSLGTPAEYSLYIRNLRLGVADVLAVREMEPEIPHLRKERNNDFIRPVAKYQSHIGYRERARKEQNITTIKRG